MLKQRMSDFVKRQHWELWMKTTVICQVTTYELPMPAMSAYISNSTVHHIHTAQLLDYLLPY